ncbi:MAG: DSBA oxidoreductase [Parcubacteria group bacterium GW2011_GWA2_39_18]|nr:MAG: DSBA oxidoreductase [Parcubacteria group bacterium GW2011_GWA2_39_18]
MDQKENKWIMPLAIVAAGLLIAGAVIYGNKNSSNEGPAASDNPLKRISVLGDEKASVSLIVYSDFQCPFCKKWHDETAQQIIDEYVKIGKVKIEYKDFAFLGQESIKAAMATKCAKEQGLENYLNYHDYLFDNQKGENQGQFSVNNLKRFAKNLELDADKFNSCLDSNKYKDEVQKETNEGKAAGVTGTPSSLINGELIIGAQPYEVFKRAIDDALKAGK